jgi:hypothetical protein
MAIGEVLFIETLMSLLIWWIAEAYMLEILHIAHPPLIALPPIVSNAMYY